MRITRLLQEIRHHLIIKCQYNNNMFVEYLLSGQLTAIVCCVGQLVLSGGKLITKHSFFNREHAVMFVY